MFDDMMDTKLGTWNRVWHLYYFRIQRRSDSIIIINDGFFYGFVPIIRSIRFASQFGQSNKHLFVSIVTDFMCSPSIRIEQQLHRLIHVSMGVLCRWSFTTMLHYSIISFISFELKLRSSRPRFESANGFITKQSTDGSPFNFTKFLV